MEQVSVTQNREEQSNKKNQSAVATSKKTKLSLKVFFSLLLAGILVYFCFKNVALEDFQAALLRLKLPLFLLAALMSICIIFLNTVQLRGFLPDKTKISFSHMFHIVSVFSMTVNVVPFWGGHALFIYLLGHRQRLGKTVAFTVMTLDQIAEGFAKIFIFGVVLLTLDFPDPFPPQLIQAMQGLLVAVALAYSCLCVFAFLYRNKTHTLVGSPRSLSYKIKHFIYNWADHLRVLRSARAMIWTVGLAVFMKILEVFAVFLVQKALGLELGLSAAFLMVAAHSVATAAPLTPMRLGLFEAAATMTYVYLGETQAMALALGVLIHVAHTLPFIIAGYMSSLRLGFRRKQLSEYSVSQ